MGFKVSSINYKMMSYLLITLNASAGSTKMKEAERRATRVAPDTDSPNENVSFWDGWRLFFMLSPCEDEWNEAEGTKSGNCLREGYKYSIRTRRGRGRGKVEEALLGLEVERERWGLQVEHNETLRTRAISCSHTQMQLTTAKCHRYHVDVDNVARSQDHHIISFYFCWK